MPRTPRFEARERYNSPKYDIFLIGANGEPMASCFEAYDKKNVARAVKDIRAAAASAKLVYVPGAPGKDDGGEKIGRAP